MGMEQVAGLLQGVNSLIGAMSEKRVKTTRSGSTTTSGLDLSKEAVDAMVADILQGNAGLAAVSSGQKAGGMYNSTVNQQLVNDLVARASAETAKAQAKTVQTTSPSQDVQVTPPAMGLGDAALGFGGAMLANKLWKASGAGDLLDEAIGGIFGGGAGDAAEAATEGVASIMSTGFDPFGAAGDVMGDVVGNFGDLTGLGDFSGMPFASMGMDILGGDLGGALESGATYMAMNTLIPGSGFLAPLLGDLNPISALTGGLGDMVSSLVGGLGDMLGGLFGGGSVVCTELAARGILNMQLYYTDIRYAREHMAEGTLRGYRLWGVPLVRLMRHSRLVTHVVAYFAVARAHYIASISKEYTGDWCPRLAERGRKVQAVGVPLCNFLSRFTSPIDDSIRTSKLYSSQGR